MNNNCKRTLNGVQKYYNLFDKENSVNGEDNIPSKKIKTYGNILENRIEIANSNIKKEEINIDKLPLFILAYILSKTGYPMMMKVMLVSQKWRKAANTKIFYESMLRDMSNEILIKFEIPEHNYELIPQYFKEKSWKEIFQLKRIIKSDPKESDNIEKDADQTRVLGTKIIDKIGFYEGELKGNKQDGKGILYKIKLGKVYEGDFDKGKITGVGKRTWPNKDTYEGNFLESKRNGEGILKLVGTGEYRGSFVNDKREGDGEMRFENGDVYRGSWKNDMANGFGTFSSKSGYVYEGEWVDNHKSGKGKLIYQRGTYEGDWKNNKAHGKGEIIFKNGTKYIGEMYENSWHGKGQFYWNDGRIYDGDFYYSKQQGQGKIISSDGSICYEGSFRNNRPHGFGILYLKSGYKYKGNMKNGLKDGNGEIFDSNGRLCMSGEFCEGNYITKNPINTTTTNSNLINLNPTNFNYTNSFELPSNNDTFNSIQISH